MTFEQRAERRRREREIARTGKPAIAPDSTYGVVCGWAANDSDVEEAKRQTHDALLRLMGQRRRGPVSWLIHEAGPEASQALADMATPADPPELAAHYRQLRGLLREYGGVLVIALAEQAGLAP